jgi:hypothetical protein
MGLFKNLMLFGKSGLQGLSTRVPLLLRDIQLRLSKGATRVPLFTIWDSVAGPGRTPMPGNNSGRIRSEMFPGIGSLPEPATGSHVVNRGTPVAPYRLIDPERKSHPRGKPLQPSFPNIMSCLRSPITAEPQMTH